MSKFHHFNPALTCPAHSSLHLDGLWSQQGSSCWREIRPDPEEEHAALQRSIKTLHSQIAAERSRREAVEQEMELTVRENQGLEQRLALLDGCRARQKELETEVEQLQLQWRADCANRWARTELSVFFSDLSISPVFHILSLGPPASEGHSRCWCLIRCSSSQKKDPPLARWWSKSRSK